MMPSNVSSHRLNMFSRLLDFFENHWIWKTLITFLPSIWFPIVVNNVAKRYQTFSWLLITDQNDPNFGDLSNWGWAITISIFVLFFTFSLLTTIGSISKKQKTIEELTTADASKSALLSLIDKNYIHEHNTLKKKINKMLNGIDPLVPPIINPMDCMRTIVVELKAMIRNTWFTQRDTYPHLIISLACRAHNGKWEWVKTEDTDEGLSLEQLTEDENSSFNKCQKNEHGFLFYNDKKDAYGNQAYIYDIDEGNAPNGSILCQHFVVKVNQDCTAEAVLSISSKNGKFVEYSKEELAIRRRWLHGNEEDKNAHIINEAVKYRSINWNKYIMPELSLKIKNELLLLCSKYIYEEYLAHNKNHQKVYMGVDANSGN